MPIEWQDHLQRILHGRSISTLADFTTKDVITTLICAGVHPQLKARWYEVAPRYLDILKSFNATDLQGISFDKAWFRGQTLESNDILQRVSKRYERKVNEQGRDPSYIDADNFDLLRHAFSEILGEQVIELKKVGFQSWYMEGLNILLHDTELGQALQQKTLFWENGIWTGRTYLGLAFATHAFYRHADWKFGVHTCYPYISNIASLVDIQTSRTLEGIEDVQGLGKYIRISSSNGYRLVTYEDWLAEQERLFASTDSSSIHASLDGFHHLIMRLIDEVHPTYAVELQRFAPADLLVKIYLREQDIRNPSEDHITFKHFLHLLYFDCLAKVSYRGVYFQLQHFFTDLLDAEKRNYASTIFQELREMNSYLQPFDEVAMVKNWLVYRSFATQQVHAGIEAITQHWQSVQGYLTDSLPFEELVQEIIPAVSRIDISKYSGRTHLPTFDNYSSS